jgi:hypothetical protein
MPGFDMSLVELVSSLLNRDDIHVPLARVLELATEEHLVELEGLAADYNLNLNLNRIISNHLDDAVVYMDSKVGLVIRMWPAGGVTGYWYTLC